MDLTKSRRFLSDPITMGGFSFLGKNRYRELFGYSVTFHNSLIWRLVQYFIGNFETRLNHYFVTEQIYRDVLIKISRELNTTIWRDRIFTRQFLNILTLRDFF